MRDLYEDMMDRFDDDPWDAVIPDDEHDLDAEAQEEREFQALMDALEAEQEDEIPVGMNFE